MGCFLSYIRVGVNNTYGWAIKNLSNTLIINYLFMRMRVDVGVIGAYWAFIQHH